MGYDKWMAALLKGLPQARLLLSYDETSGWFRLHYQFRTKGGGKVLDVARLLARGQGEGHGPPFVFFT